MAALKFYSSVRFLWLRASIVEAGAFVLFAAFLEFTSPRGIDPLRLVSAVAGAILAASLFSGAAFAIAVRLQPVEVRDDGIWCYNFWGVYHLLNWQEIGRVREVNVLGFRYMVVSNETGKPELWIPRFLTDMPNFFKAVQACAGDDHALTEALRRDFAYPDVTGSV